MNSNNLPQKGILGHRNNLIIIIPSLIFSLLFYHQQTGLNFFLFTLTTMVLLGISNAALFFKSTILLKALAYLISGIAVFLYNSPLTIIANLLAFFTLVGSFSEHKSSIYINWANGIYTSLVAAFTLYFEKVNATTEQKNAKKINYSYWLKTVGIPLIIVIIFISLYRNGNPKFDELISQIDFSFINFEWIVYTGLGYYLFYNITHPIFVTPATQLDLETGNVLKNEILTKIDLKKLKSEVHLGIVLLVSLNVLIAIFLVTDIIHLSEIHQMTAPELSQQVHTGVNALILSNLLAIAIILYFFRGSINFIKNNTVLKNLTFVWISLNLIMIGITAVKNVEYLISFGLTYKRIGVLFFLCFTAIGLITTFIKVSKVKNLWFLFRKNIQIAFTVLILSSTVNWDKIITYYNINYAKQLDLDYLIKLSDNNAFLLKDYVEKNKIAHKKEIKINRKHRNYMKNLQNNSWQELVFDNYKIQ
ncbi:DUF4173 domain-containing protein [Polaribacter sp. R77954]|uniref:DUF4173 domain-containing protein n=1 Tax=Polaribacter sp. R77954 TaxID=3093870 RepID=UPI0037CBBA1E